MAKIIKYEDKEIDGKQVRVIRQGLRGRLATKAKVLNIAGPAIIKACSHLFNQGKKDDEKFDFKNIDFKNIDVEEVIVPAIESFVTSLESKRFISLIEELMIGVSVNEVDVSDPDKFDHVFDDCMGTMYKVCAFAMKVNFSDLMLGLGILNGLQEGEKELKKSNGSGRK